MRTGSPLRSFAVVVAVCVMCAAVPAFAQSVPPQLTVAVGAPTPDLPANISAPAVAPPLPGACGSISQFATTNCQLTYHGITVYGTIDLGVAWQSHGTPFNGASVTGIEEFISKNGNRSLVSFAPNGLSNSNIGVKGYEEIVPGWAAIFDLQAGFDPYSLQLSNGPKSLMQNDGVALSRQTSNGDSSRAGQFYNGLGYAGISSPTFGTLTAGRQNSLTLDGVIAYDPLAASYAFSPLGYSGATAGVGDTEDARYTTALKYLLKIDPFRFAALYQAGGYGAGNASTNAYQLQAGGDFLGGRYGALSLDAIYSNVVDAVSLSALSAAQQSKYPGTLAATISNDNSIMLLARYTYGQVTLYDGYEYVLFENPSNPQTGFTDIAGSQVATANINNTAYSRNRELQIFWTGAKYAVTSDLDIRGGYYHYIQNSYNTKSCDNTSSSKCSGTLDAVSFDVDWRFAAKFDAYAGAMYSGVNGGLASGFLHHTTIDPDAGVRFRF